MKINKTLIFAHNNGKKLDQELKREGERENGEGCNEFQCYGYYRGSSNFVVAPVFLLSVFCAV